MGSSLLRRYALVVCTAGYTAVLVLLHVGGRFPIPGAYDIARLAGAPRVSFEGRVIDFPQIRWGQTRFLMEGAVPYQEAFKGRVLVQLDFPVEDLAPDEHLRVRGWLYRTREPGAKRPFNERAYWATHRTHAILRVWSPEGLDRLSESNDKTWTQEAWGFHQRFKHFWFNVLSPDEAAILSCMTMGSRGVLPPSIKDQCVRAGVYHMLVVSGQNVALLITLGVGALQLLRIPRRRAFWLCCLPILFYTCSVGADPPVMRASTMAIVALAIMAMGRDIPGIYPFALAWLWVLIDEPAALFGASFQLSFGATASLLASLTWLRQFQTIERRWLRWVVEAGAMTLAVHAGVWPLLVYYFHQISLIGFIANWTFFPLSVAVMTSGLLLGIWGVFSPNTVPACLIQGISWMLQGTLGLIRWMSEWSWAAVPISPPSWAVCGMYYGLLICILVGIHRVKKTYRLWQSSDRL
jgi:competence protein ComEC